MAEKHSKAEPVISKTRRRYKVGYVSIRYINSKTYMTTYYSQPPACTSRASGWLRQDLRPGARNGEDFGRMHCADGG